MQSDHTVSPSHPEDSTCQPVTSPSMPHSDTAGERAAKGSVSGSPRGYPFSGWVVGRRLREEQRGIVVLLDPRSHVGYTCVARSCLPQPRCGLLVGRGGRRTGEGHLCEMLQ